MDRRRRRRSLSSAKRVERRKGHRDVESNEHVGDLHRSRSTTYEGPSPKYVVG
jgi:hypothetical protein